jgi:hypothetical protein
MQRRSSDEWVARVVAWHNRHPLARHVLPAQVQAMGWVRLPFTAAGAASAETSRGRGWRAAFTEKFLPPYSPRRIARWVLRHAQGTAPDTAGLPVREILVDDRPRPADAQPVALWVATAAIVDGTVQSRVLLGPGAPRAVLGRRLWSRPRLAAVALTGLLAAGLPSGVTWLSALPWPESASVQDHDPEPGSPLAQANGAPAPQDDSAAMPAAASEVPPPSEPAGEPTAEPTAEAPASAAYPAQDAASAPVATPAPAAVRAATGDMPTRGRVELPPRPTLVPLDTPARRGSVPLPPRGLALDEATKAAAREATAAARAARAAVHAAAAPVAYAVAAPRVRTEAESELMRAALQAAVSQATPAPGCRVEALPAGDDWRVVCWPFLHRADAERLRGQLVARGHRLEVIDF